MFNNSRDITRNSLFHSTTLRFLFRNSTYDWHLHTTLHYTSKNFRLGRRVEFSTSRTVWHDWPYQRPLISYKSNHCCSMKRPVLVESSTNMCGCGVQNCYGRKKSVLMFGNWIAFADAGEELRLKSLWLQNRNWPIWFAFANVPAYFSGFGDNNFCQVLNITIEYPSGSNALDDLAFGWHLQYQSL